MGPVVPYPPPPKGYGTQGPGRDTALEIPSPPPPPREQTHPCENVTFPQLHLRAVIIPFRDLDRVGRSLHFF